MVQVENEKLVYRTGTGHFAGFFSTSAILRHNLASATDTTALDAIEQMRSRPALAEPDLFITSPSSPSAIRRIKDDLHRYILSPDPTREEANQSWGVIPVRRTRDTRRAQKRTQRARRSAEGTEGNVSIPGAQRSCVSLRANCFCTAGERGNGHGCR